MAYNFVRASNHHIEIAGLPDITTTLSLSVRLRIANAIGTGEQFLIFSKFKDSTDRNFQFDYINSGGNTGMRIAWNQPVSTLISYSDSANILTVGTWYHFLATADWTTNPDSIHLYQDNAEATLNRSGSDNATPTTGAPQLSRIGGIAGASSSNFDGDICELAIWDTILTADEARALGAKASPLTVHPSNLVMYAPMVRDLIDHKGTTTFTNQGATVVAHPPVIRI
jgi:Concanavalin A-like lectin/glucanases superfamily